MECQLKILWQLFLLMPNYSTKLCSFFSGVLLHVVLSLPTYLLSSWCHVIAVVHILVLSILRTWSIHPSQFLIKILLFCRWHWMFLCCGIALHSRSSLGIYFFNSVSFTCSWMCQASSFLALLFSTCHFLMLFIKTDTTKLSYNFNIAWMKNFEELHNLHYLLNMLYFFQSVVNVIPQ